METVGNVLVFQRRIFSLHELEHDAADGHFVSDSTSSAWFYG